MGPKALATFIVLMILSPVAIVVVAYTLFPEVIKEPLPIRVSLAGYLEPEAVAASVVRFRAGQGKALEPYVTVINEADYTINSVYVTLNRRFVFHAADPLEPGDSKDFYLSRFQEHDGSPFRPDRYDIRLITVKGRLPSLKQAMYEIEWEKLTAQEEAPEPVVIPVTPATPDELPPSESSEGDATEDEAEGA